MAISRALRFQILRRDNHTCRYCGATAPDVKLTVDHVVPTALGGSDDPTNLVTACAGCNGGKSATPPDAALVAQVDEDAIRWARAREAAAQKALADLETRQANRGAFRERWQNWKAGGKPLPLPGDWEPTVDRFIARGLPLPLLLDAIDVSMSRDVRADTVFNYMCGVAWNKVREIEETAQAALAADTTAPEPGALVDDTIPVAVVEDMLANALGGNIDEDTLVDLARDARDDLRGQGWQSPSALTVLAHVVDRIAQEWAEADQLVDDTLDVLGNLPEPKRLTLARFAEDEARRRFEISPDDPVGNRERRLAMVLIGARFAAASEEQTEGRS